MNIINFQRKKMVQMDNLINKIINLYGYGQLIIFQNDTK